MNIIQTWLYLIRTPERARKLRSRIGGLKPPPLDALFGPEPAQCPLTVLDGAEASRRAYANPQFRPALDAWDTGYVTPADLRRWCVEIERGAVSWPIDQVARATPLATIARTPLPYPASVPALVSIHGQRPA